jgi:hypothetical protein
MCGQDNPDCCALCPTVVYCVLHRMTLRLHQTPPHSHSHCVPPCTRKQAYINFLDTDIVALDDWEETYYGNSLRIVQCCAAK